MKQKISIIVPIYNVQDFLDEMLQSLYKQTIGFEHLEVLLIDDGSTDNSRSIIEQWTNHHANVKGIYFDQPSGSAGRPRNVGIQYATGEYILFADPDDLFELDGCKRLYELAEKYRSDIVMGMFQTFLSNGVYMHDIYKNTLIEPIVNFTIAEHPIVLNAPFNLMCKLFKTDFLKYHNILFFEEVAAQDNPFSTEAFLAAKSITYTPTIIYNYRIREDTANLSITQQRSLKYFKDFSFTRQEVIKIYTKYNKVDYFKIRYCADLNWLFNQLFLSSDTTMSELEAVMKEISWFIELSEQADIHALTEEKQQLLLRMRNADYDIILAILMAQQVIMKQNFKKSFQ